MKRFIVSSTTFEAIHCWPECDVEGVEFLKNPHRHIFHVKLKIEVFHDDRDLEFIKVKQELDAVLTKQYRGKDIGRTSCEQIADRIKRYFPKASFISVYEDNENGVEVEYGESK